MLYNPMNEAITREIKVPVYYTGLHDEVVLQNQNGTSEKIKVNRDYEITINVTIPANRTQYLVLK
jgi:hypothetical protein